MLLVKIVEGLVRLFGGIGFDRSKHTMDSGILGACGLLGCCGPRKKRRSRRHSHRHKHQEMLAPRDSDLSSYLPPAGSAINNGGFFTQSRKGSGNSQPPSVLKPEHANRPYKEELVVDNDDDGYIMGAWRPSPRPSSGYFPVSDGPQTTVPGNFVLQPPQKPKLSSSPSPGSTTTPGFSRIGGGRSHIDTPYAITTGSTHTFPSIGHQSPSLNQSSSALAGQPLFYEHSLEDNEDDLPLALSNVESGIALGNNGLPLSAMDAHIRTKSQSAIIENYLPAGSGLSPAKQYQAFQPPARRKYLSQDFLRPSENTLPTNKFMFGGGPDPDDDSGDEEDQQKKKKPWYHLRRPRLHSTEGHTSTSPSITDLGGGGAVDGEMGGLVPGDSKQQRSFVVIRKPVNSMGRLNQPSSSATPVDVSRPPTR